MDNLKMDDIERSVIDWQYKGMPPSIAGIALSEIGRQGLNILNQDMLFPVALLKRSALEHNRRWMQNFLAATGARICPHGKTTMAPQLFAQQMEDGAWGMTAATISHVRVYRQFGVKRILFANQLIGPQEIEYIIDAMRCDPEFDFYCLVDSLEGLQRLNAALARAPLGRPFQVLLELGVPGGRTGVRDVREALSLARAIAACGPAISLRGVEVYEGIVPDRDQDDADAQVRLLLQRAIDVTGDALREGLFGAGEIVISAGGSAYFDLAANLAATVLATSGDAREVTTVLRSGCYLTHDDHLYADYFERIVRRTPLVAKLGPGLRPAIELCAQLQSIPEARLAIAGFGKRDVSHDVHLPTALWWFRPGQHAAVQALPDGVQISRLNDQHAYLELPYAHGFEVGDLLGFGISHPCTTFDKWRLLTVVDDDYNVVSAVRTYF